MLKSGFKQHCKEPKSGTPFLDTSSQLRALSLSLRGLRMLPGVLLGDGVIQEPAEALEK